MCLREIGSSRANIYWGSTTFFFFAWRRWPRIHYFPLQPVWPRRRLCAHMPKPKKESTIKHILNCLIGSDWIDENKCFWVYSIFLFLEAMAQPSLAVAPAARMCKRTRARALARALVRARKEARARGKRRCPVEHLRPYYWFWRAILPVSKL